VRQELRKKSANKDDESMSICQLQPEYDIGSPHGTWMDEERSKMTCIKEGGKKGGMYQPFYGTLVADFMLK